MQGGGHSFAAKQDLRFWRNLLGQPSTVSRAPSSTKACSPPGLHALTSSERPHRAQAPTRNTPSGEGRSCRAFTHTLLINDPCTQGLPAASGMSTF